MKLNSRAVFICIIFLSVSIQLYGQHYICGVDTFETGPSGLQKTVLLAESTGPQNLVLLFVDFKDGRKQPGDIIPTQDSDTALVDNIDAVGGMGYELIDPNEPSLGWRKKIRKYEYEDYWNMIFTQGTYSGANVHPDYSSHDIEVFGSFRDYYNEVSYGNMDIIPYPTKSGGSGMYYNGIVNPIDEAGGKKYIRWLMLEGNKSDYPGLLKQSKSEIDDILDSLYSNNQTTFNRLDYTGKIMVIFAGGATEAGVGGNSQTPGQYSSVVEKRIRNTNNQSTLIGISLLIHEFGHNLGLLHIPSSTYDPMNPYILTSPKHHYCPSHFNPIYKLQRGWINTGDFTKINSNYDPLNLSPSHTNSDFATVTLFGDALHNDDSEHSEYFVLEYRTREGFNRFSGGENPTSFQGGVLVWHYSPYDKFLCYNRTEGSEIGLKVESPDNFNLDTGNPQHFFYSGHSRLNSGTTPNSSSGMGITTGISLTDFTINGSNEMVVDVDYDLGDVPSYTNVLTENTPSNNISITGNTYVEGLVSGQITVNDNSHVEFAPNASLYSYYMIADASSQGSISFRGAFAYGSPRLTWDGIELNIGYSSPKSKIRKCLVTDVNSEDGAIDVILYAVSVNKEPTIQNNEFQNCSLDLNLKNYSTIEDIKYMELSGYDNNDLNTIAVSGYWKLTQASTFTIPSGVHMTVNFPPPILIYDPYPDTYFKFAENTSLICRGYLKAVGNSNNELKFTQNSSGIWGGIKFYGNGNGIIDNVKIEYTKKGLNIYSTNNITVKNSTIEHFTEQGIYVRDSDIKIDNCTIKNPNGASHGIYLYDYCDPEITGTTVSVPGGTGIYQEYGNGSIHDCTIKNCVSGIKTNITSMEIYNNFITDNTYGIRLAGYSPVNIHDNDIYDNDVGLYLEQSQPSVVKWNNFGFSIVKGYLYEPNNDEGVLVNSLQYGNTFLGGKRNNFIDGGSTLDIKNLKSITLNATGNAWDIINNVGPVSTYPVQSFNNNAGPGGSLGKMAEEFFTENELVVPDKFVLEQNYPNPFNPSTTIKFHLPEDSNIHLVIYDILGRVVHSLVSDASYPAGIHQVDWDGTNEIGNHLSSGVYFYRMKAVPVNGGKTFNDSRKLVYLR
jgi:M6 family metalloprotease-like protein